MHSILYSLIGKGKSDPYAVITVGAQQWKTKHIDNDVNPRWEYWCEVSTDYFLASVLSKFNTGHWTFFFIFSSFKKFID